MKRRSLLKLIPLPTVALLPFDALADMRKRMAEATSMPPQNIQPRMTATEVNRLHDEFIRQFAREVEAAASQQQSRLRGFVK